MSEFGVGTIVVPDGCNWIAGRPQSEIVPVFRERLRRTRAEELATGIDEFLAIAQDRLKRAAT